MNTGSPLPPDRSGIDTEQRNPRTMQLHNLPAGELVRLLRQEDAAVLDALAGAEQSLSDLVTALEPRFEAGGRLIYIGAGTSGRLGVLDASEAPPTFQVEPGRVVGIIAGGDDALRRSSEFREDDPDGARADLAALALQADDTLIGIAAGGTTPYVLGGLALAKQLQPRCQTGLLVCTRMTRPGGVDHFVVLETGPEVITGSTRMKAGTATKLALNTISTALMIRTGRVYENLMVDLKASNDKLRDRAGRIVATLTGLSRTQSFALLEDAGGAVKTAVVMHRRQLGRAEAEQALARCRGRLHQALEAT